jgi:hypothetical protein
MHEEWSGTIGTDYKSVLDMLRHGDHDPQEEDTPINLDGNKVVLDALHPDWDVFIEIQDAMQNLPQVCLTYVKGHQDQENPYTTLNMMGQLNANADHEAGAFQDVHGLERLLVLMSPLTRAHPHLNGTVTGKYDQNLQHEATTKPLLEYIWYKNHWTPSIMESIHWAAHAHALTNLQTKLTWLHFFTNGCQQRGKPINLTKGNDSVHYVHLSRRIETIFSVEITRHEWLGEKNLSEISTTIACHAILTPPFKYCCVTVFKNGLVSPRGSLYYTLLLEFPSPNPATKLYRMASDLSW